MAREAGRWRPQSRPRTASRVAAVQALFQGEQAQDSAEAVIEQFIRHRLGALPDQDGPGDSFDEGHVPDAQVDLFRQIVLTATARQDVIDPLLADSLPADWKLERLDPVLRALLRAGSAELSLGDGPPAKVVINEYLDVAHGFFTGDEPRLANGVLNNVARKLRPAEFPPETESV
jgi:N utilization substance protein B